MPDIAYGTRLHTAQSHGIHICHKQRKHFTCSGWTPCFYFGGHVWAGAGQPRVMHRKKWEGSSISAVFSWMQLVFYVGKKKKGKNTPKVSHGSPENQPLESMIFRTWKPRYTLGCVLPSPWVIWAVIVCVVGPCYYLSIHHDIYYIWYVMYRYNNFDIHFKSEL